MRTIVIALLSCFLWISTVQAQILPPTPSRTPTRTPTRGPVFTWTPRPSPTFRPTLTPAPTWTPRPTLTPRLTTTPRPTTTPLATRTPTPTLSAPETAWIALCANLGQQSNPYNQVQSRLGRLNRHLARRIPIAPAQLAQFVNTINTNLDIIRDLKGKEAVLEEVAGAERSRRVMALLDQSKPLNSPIIPQQCRGAGRRAESYKANFAACDEAEALFNQLEAPIEVRELRAFNRIDQSIDQRIGRLEATLGFLNFAGFAEPAECSTRLEVTDTQQQLEEKVRQLRICSLFLSSHPVTPLPPATDTEKMVGACLGRRIDIPGM